MKMFFNRYLSFFVIAICIFSCFGVNNRQDATNTKLFAGETSGQGVAVLELFTSQGCSSCPPADRLLGSLSKMKNVIALSFHVDYWNRFGWTDPFSSSLYSRRQIAYASALHSDVYTPQLIVNGQNEMIGSDSNKIIHTMDKIISQQPTSEVNIESVKNDHGMVVVHFTVNGLDNGCIANVAVVEPQATTNIRAGENGGRSLTSYNIVRRFETFEKIKNGDNEVSFDFSTQGTGLSVVVYIQQQNKNIIAADQKSL